ncbi:MAG: cobalamin-dependent protein [Spirochaetales bacterium]|nr:cobalamin-dependent protein [Spirochaetales bacterium]
MFDSIKLKDAMGDLDEDTALEMLKSVMANGGQDVDAALAACQEGMSVVGKRFEAGDYFIGDLIFSGELMTSAMNIIRPALVAKRSESSSTKILMCTVEGDLHDIGKNIVKAIFEAGGFDVVDLGIDVAPAKIVETIKEQNIKIIALSGVLTLAIDAMKRTIDAFATAGIRNDVKVIIGGAPVNAGVSKLVGSDAWAINPQEGYEICQAWAGSN